MVALVVEHRATDRKSLDSSPWHFSVSALLLWVPLKPFETVSWLQTCLKDIAVLKLVRGLRSHEKLKCRYAAQLDLNKYRLSRENRLGERVNI